METGKAAVAFVGRGVWRIAIIVCFALSLSVLPAQRVGWGAVVQGGLVQLQGSFEQLPDFPYRH